MHFLTLEEIRKIPVNCNITYTRIAIDYHKQKDSPNRVRTTIGGNVIDYPGKLTTCMANLTNTKIMWNSVVNTDEAQYAFVNIKSF